MSKDERRAAINERCGAEEAAEQTKTLEKHIKGEGGEMNEDLIQRMLKDELEKAHIAQELRRREQARRH